MIKKNLKWLNINVDIGVENIDDFVDKFKIMYPGCCIANIFITLQPKEYPVGKEGQIYEINNIK
jgi:hypothetical protein